jgi:hypothetical protein
MNRKVYHVVMKNEAWHVRRTRARRSSGCHMNKSAAIVQAKRLASRRGSLGQVVVHGREVQREWMYGRDPRRTRG